MLVGDVDSIVYFPRPFPPIAPWIRIVSLLYELASDGP